MFLPCPFTVPISEVRHASTFLSRWTNPRFSIFVSTETCPRHLSIFFPRSSIFVYRSHGPFVGFTESSAC